MEERQTHREGLVWPVILIGAGVVFLLNNLGVLSWSIWGSLWRLWPVLLIAVGLDILVGRRSLWASLAVALLLVAVLAAAVLIGLPGQIGAGDAFTAERTEAVNELLNGAERADVEIGFGAGTLRLAALPEGSTLLLAGEADLSRGEEMALDRGGAAGVGRLTLRSRNSFHITNFRGQESDKAWDLALNRDIPLRLTVNTGVGTAALDLARLNLAELTIDGGMGEATVTLPPRGRFAVTVDGGVGEITLVIPEALAARVRVEGGLGGVTVDEGFDRADDAYTSPGFSSAQDRVDIRIRGGIGQVRIRRPVE